MELANRLSAQGLLRRQPDRADRRRVYVRLTPRGSRRLQALAAVHRQQLRRLRPQLQALLDSLPPADELGGA